MILDLHTWNVVSMARDTFVALVLVVCFWELAKRG